MNKEARALERHDFWPGLVVLLAGAAVVLCGARHLTSLNTTNGDAAWETQLIKAFSSGGLQYASQVPPPPPPKTDNLANPGEALERWAQQQASVPPPAWKVRVDVGAKTPCPT